MSNAKSRKITKLCASESTYETETSNSSNSIDSSDSSDSDESDGEHIDKEQGDFNFGDLVDGRYVLIKKIGYGTFSTIWLTYLLKSNKFFAMKIFHADEICNHEGLSEVTKITKLTSMKFKMTQLHEVLKFTPLGSDSKIASICLVMDILTCNIKSLSRDDEKMEESIVLKIIHDTAELLNYLLTYGYMYTDLRPENIMIKTNDARLDALQNAFTNLNFDSVYSTMCSDIITKHGFSMSNKKHKKKYNMLKRTTVQQYIQNTMPGIISSVKDIDHAYQLHDNMEVFLIDFATIRKIEKKNTNYHVQSRNYTSPEILVCIPYSYKIDVWSLGCIMYELFAGDYMIEPQGTRSYGTDENHLYWIIELIDKFPKHMTQSNTAKQFFFATGKFRVNIEEKDWCIEKSLECDGAIISDSSISLIKSMVNIDPINRPTYTEIITSINEMLS
jgi:serine/threonine-protein kinase SRPK3